MGHSSSSSSGFRSHSIFFACVRSLPFLHSTFFTFFFFFFFFTFVVVVSSSSSLSILSSYLGHNNLWFWKDKNKFEKKNSVTSRVFFSGSFFPSPSQDSYFTKTLSLSLSLSLQRDTPSCFLVSVNRNFFRLVPKQIGRTLFFRPSSLHFLFVAFVEKNFGTWIPLT